MNVYALNTGNFNPIIVLFLTDTGILMKNSDTFQSYYSLISNTDLLGRKLNDVLISILL